ncbi:hypothetical protein V8B97DRAFT_2003926 [Scleroderma yunnanense]
MAAKKRCQLQAESPCNSAVLRIVGQCPHCRAEFCGAVIVRPVLSCETLQHRLPEHHNCNKLEDCRQQAFERNKAKLESERTVASKMATA